jgi:probable phosphoglycerate mutase
MNFLFLRHGQTRCNAEKRFQGRIDVSLNENGKLQARQVATVLPPKVFLGIVTSPALRAVETAWLLADAHGTEVVIEPDLMEFFVGSFEGKRVSRTLAEHGLGPGAPWMDVLPEDADRWEDFKPRVCEAVGRWTERFADEILLFASHGLVFNALTESLLGQQVFSLNAQPFSISPGISGWDLKSLV